MKKTLFAVALLASSSAFAMDVSNPFYVQMKGDVLSETAISYENFEHVDTENVLKALREGDDELLANSIGNSLEEAATKLVPEIAQIKQTLKDRGFKIVLMSGSGSTVFALSTDSSLMKKVESDLEDHYFVYLTKIINK